MTSCADEQGSSGSQGSTSWPLQFQSLTSPQPSTTPPRESKSVLKYLHKCWSQTMRTCPVSLGHGRKLQTLVWKNVQTNKPKKKKKRNRHDTDATNGKIKGKCFQKLRSGAIKRCGCVCMKEMSITRGNRAKGHSLPPNTSSSSPHGSSLHDGDEDTVMCNIQ